ncbi:MAG TPA: (2Fe-2S)-binding protein [Pirellulales bacterium]|nr:(2Fe-2S)-binding protein [Pirellulales bacterium]
MDLDDEVCLCFHVSKRKVLNFLRVEKPRRPGQLSECFGAGTGCGWCRTYLKRLFEEAVEGKVIEALEPSPAEYARRRAGYIRSGGGTPPPGATPLDDEPCGNPV